LALVDIASFFFRAAYRLGFGVTRPNGAGRSWCRQLSVVSYQ
jgi:hypothetical protein